MINHETSRREKQGLPSCRSCMQMGSSLRKASIFLRSSSSALKYSSSLCIRRGGRSSARGKLVDTHVVVTLLEGRHSKTRPVGDPMPSFQLCTQQIKYAVQGPCTHRDNFEKARRFSSYGLAMETLCSLGSITPTLLQGCEFGGRSK